MPRDAHLWMMTDIDITAGKEEQSTETTNLLTVIMDLSGGDESDHGV